MKRLTAALLCAMMLFSFPACSQKDANDGGTEQDENYVVYEAIFLDNGEILDIFSDVRGDEAPFEQVTKDFHVTTNFMPEKDSHELYGEKAEIHITGYKCAEVKDDDGGMTANEGLCVTISCEDAALQRHIDSLDNNWHITGAYKDAAKYTGYIDFSDAQPVDYTVTGTFGGSMSSGEIVFDPEEAEALLND